MIPGKPQAILCTAPAQLWTGLETNAGLIMQQIPERLFVVLPFISLTRHASLSKTPTIPGARSILQNGTTESPNPPSEVIRSYGTIEFDSNLSCFFGDRESWAEKQREERNLRKVPVTLPNGANLHLSAGGQNVLIKTMVEEFCPRFAPGGQVLYVDDTNHAEGAIDIDKLRELNVTIPERGKAPDLIVWMEDRQWLFLMEACSTHGPIDVTRKDEMRKLFSGHKGSVVYVSCFPTRKVMQKYLSDLAWETEAWCSDTPDHMIHLDGEKFMGPYRIDE